MKRLSIFLFFLVFTALLYGHDIHFTITNIDIVKNKIKMTVRILPNDFSELNYFTGLSAIEKHEYLYHGQHHNQVSVTALNDNEVKQLADYVNHKITLETSENSIRLKPTKNNYDGEYYWINFEGNLSENVKKITITNNLFIEVFNYQHNLLMLNINGKEQGIEFTVEVTKKTISL